MGEGQQHCHWVTKQIKGDYQRSWLETWKDLMGKETLHPCLTPAVLKIFMSFKTNLDGAWSTLV